MKCHLCEESLLCPIHDPEEYAAAEAFQKEQAEAFRANLYHAICVEPIPWWARVLSWAERKVGRR